MPEVRPVVPVNLLAGVLCGDETALRTLDALPIEELEAAARYHAVTGLLSERLSAAGGTPSHVIQRLRDLAFREAVVDLIRERQLRVLIEALDVTGVRALLIKGAHLAYSHYHDPALRPRLDTDLLIRPADRDVVDRILRSQGYEPQLHVSGALVSSQRMYVKSFYGSPVHIVDLHWKIANQIAFADMLTFDDVAARATALPRLSRRARGLSDVDALLLACVHRVAHHHDSDCLIWLYDIHLLAGGMAPAGWQAFVSLARDRKMTAICRHSLQRAAALFRTEIPEQVRVAFANTDAQHEPSASYLRANRRPAADIITDLGSLRSWRARWQLVREHLFPSVDYMRGVYAPASGAPLPVLYAHRALHGARKWLAPR